MGFKFYNLNLIYRACFTSFSGTIPRSSSPISGIQLLNFHLQNSSAFFENPTYKISRRWHLGHSHHDDDQLQSRRSGKGVENIFKLGLGADIGLAAGKAVTGYLTGSTAIIADAAHSVSDVVLSGVALWSFKAAKAPKDKEHPYGHGKFESLGALGISCMLLATAGGIAWHALDLLLGLLSASPEVINQSLSHEHVHNHSSSGHDHGIDMNHPVLGLSMIIISISVKEGLYWITKQAGEKRGSGLMKANAWHHRADAISSVVALVGVGGAIVGVKFLDPLAGLVVSGLILKAGLETGYQSILELVDAAIPADYLDPIKTTIKQVECVKGCHRLRGRRAGSSLYLDVHIEVDPFLSVSAAHEIGENVRSQIQDSHHEVSEVFIHIDPSISELPPSMEDMQGTLMNTTNQNRINFLAEEKDIEEIVCNIISSKFPEKMEVKHITHHLLQGKILLQIEVSMPHDIFIRDAMELAKRAEAEIFKSDSNIVHVGIQLCLGNLITRSRSRISNLMVPLQ